MSSAVTAVVIILLILAIRTSYLRITYVARSRAQSCLSRAGALLLIRPAIVRLPTASLPVAPLRGRRAAGRGLGRGRGGARTQAPGSQLLQAEYKQSQLIIVLRKSTYCYCARCTNPAADGRSWRSESRRVAAWSASSTARPYAAAPPPSAPCAPASHAWHVPENNSHNQDNDLDVGGRRGGVHLQLGCRSFSGADELRSERIS